MNTVLIIIAVICIAFALICRKERTEIRKEMKLYAERMEAAELDLHAIRSVASHRLHGAGKSFAELSRKIMDNNVQLNGEEKKLIQTMAYHIQDVEDIVNERGPKTIGGQPFWTVEPVNHSYEYGPQYPQFPVRK
ncbi:hypothetical protein P6O13_004589 [Klebsiella aerogenes]|nr:hypothetical protein [Klebsiella aerogenes]